PAPFVPVVRLSGPIGMNTPLVSSLTLAGVAHTLNRAFSSNRAVAVAIAINSPGGSPVQSHLIFSRIRQLAAENKLPVYVFAEDVAASGGYMLALAGDEIYADPSSIVGSIGVVSASFGFDKLIEKIGVERRIYTAGKSKAILDPFQPEKAEDVKRLKSLQVDIHESFKQMVRDRRAGKLSANETTLFNGAFWTGQKALELGLIDGLGDMRAILREKFGDKVYFKLVSPDRGWVRRRLSAVGQTGFGGPSRITEGWADELIGALEARAIWSRFGL
ncbi:MAG: S49 family peptidase, partial [Fimbriimonadaceae bacterium]|nr:S49 family peptidase [Alphaproteobacteria bacterium]